MKHYKKLMTFMFVFIISISSMLQHLSVDALAVDKNMKTLKDNDIKLVTAKPFMDSLGYALTTTMKDEIVFVTISTVGELPTSLNENGEEGYWVGIEIKIPKKIAYTYSVAMDYSKAAVPYDYYVDNNHKFEIYFNAGGHDSATLDIMFEDNSKVTYEVDFSDVLLKETNTYSFWNGKQLPILAKTEEGIPQVPNIIKAPIYQQDTTAYTMNNQANWLLGVTIEEYKGALLATWGYDTGTNLEEEYPLVSNKENTIYEETYYAWSYDLGITWTEPVKFEAFDLPEGEIWATTHGVSFVGEDGKLYYLLNCFQNRDSVTGIRPARLELLRWDDNNQIWTFVSTCATNFQAQSKPVKLNNGHWFMSGCVTIIGESGYAISDNTNDFTSFTWMKTPGVSGSTSSHYYSETSFWYNEAKDQIILTIRSGSKNDLAYANPDLWGVTPDSQANMRLPIMISTSNDGGLTFSSIESSEFFAAPSRRINGYLSDGRPYIIFNHTPRYYDARRRLIIGVGEVGSSSINRLYALEDYDIDGGTSGGAKSYPDAIESNGVLYITYADSIYTSISGNRNNAKMIAVPLDSIPKQTSLAKLKLLIADLGDSYTSEAYNYATEVVIKQNRTASEIDMAYLLLESEVE